MNELTEIKLGSYSKKLGIVGKPNTGKSTFFSAATLVPVEISNYSFTTIKPNRGIGYLRTPCVCKEFGVDDNPVNSLCFDGIRFIPVELIDCAGLVPGAWQGRGLGNQFLDEIRKADALIHIVDAAGTTDSEGKLSKPGSHDPIEDLHFLEVEMTMWLTQILKRDWPKLARKAESNKKPFNNILEERLSGLGINRNHVIEALRKTELNENKPVSWSNDDLINFSGVLRRLAKPMLIAANKIDIPKATENLERLKGRSYTVIPCSAEAELVLRRASERRLIDYKPGDPDFIVVKPVELTEMQKKALLTVRKKILLKIGSTGVQDAINHAFFQLLNMIVVYTVEDPEGLCDHDGRILPDAYIVPHGTTARQLAYIIHTELGESFIYAIEVREKRRVGEKYLLKDRDVLSIISAKKRV